MKAKPLTKEHILLAMRMTKSNRAAAKYLGVSYIHYKMWAKRYVEFEGGRNLFEVHKNQAGKGVPKHMGASKQVKWDISEVIEGTLSPTHFRPAELKLKLIEKAYLKEECYMCGFHERRLSDYKMPLILDFVDGNPHNYGLYNIRLLCYNCYFMNVGEVFNDKDMLQLETNQQVFGTSEAIEFELDDYQKQRLVELGLYQPPKPENDGSEFISRL